MDMNASRIYPPWRIETELFEVNHMTDLRGQTARANRPGPPRWRAASAAAGCRDLLVLPRDCQWHVFVLHVQYCGNHMSRGFCVTLCMLLLTACTPVAHGSHSAGTCSAL